MSLREGQFVGSIRLERELGRGGMGEVYEGFDTKLERRVALKTIRFERRFAAEMKQRFLREARILSKLGHPGICQVYDWIETADADFLVLEFVEGKTLHAELASGISLERTLALFEAICDPLDAAHRQRIVHRDLKPENLMVHGDKVKILDFGIARTEDGTDDGFGSSAAASDPALQTRDTLLLVATETMGADSDRPTERVESGSGDSTGRLTAAGSTVGTRHYMSPEQASGKAVSTATDIYALGVCLGDALESLRTQGEAISTELQLLVWRMKALEPERRPSAREVGEQLARVRDEPRRRRRQRLAGHIALVGGVALIAVAAAFAWLAHQAREARAEAEHRRTQAEALVEFMLGDLRRKLTEVGRLDLLKDVNSRALNYFAAIESGRESLGDMSARIKLLTHLADVAIQTGDAADGERWILDALAVAERYAARDPESADHLGQMAEIQSWLGYVQTELNRPADEVLKRFQAAVSLYEQLGRLQPDAKVHWAHASAVSNVGAYLAQMERWQEAQTVLARAADIRRATLPRLETESQSGARSELAATLGWLSSVEEALFRLPQATAAREEAVALLRDVARQDPANRLPLADLVVALRFQAGLHALQGRLDAAQTSLEEASSLGRELVDVDPHNASWQRMLALVEAALAQVLAQRGDSISAQARLGAAQLRIETLIERNGAQSDWAQQLRRIELRRIEWLAAAGEKASARAALSALRTVLPADDLDPPLRLRLAQLELALAESADDRRKAHAALDAVLRELQPKQLYGDLALANAAARASLAIGCKRTPLLDQLIAAGSRSPELLAACSAAGLDCKDPAALARQPLAPCAAIAPP